ncbi:elongation factor P [candidate division WWE3 bacterium CG10_big_fil_rev_8_21_14_0_10_32_10]|uniref:Elongation factor P n=1 Tax=candidate division WWE3 bacterium CG10_big_fil_rev_8_21_14_0_10_32_10 TaxID=1975090 RepID=A0A2H0RAZ8_UNCKA|nr:MAG: elongation factor P [candidate division WWE3 bacterium CG10_big_fil_rev_8_21_14_0_10_32_10]
MILSQNLRNGTTFIYQNEPWVVLKYSHIKMARSDAIIKVKIKNIKTNVIKEASYNSSEKFDEVVLENVNMQYLYKDGDNLIFMNPDTFEQSAYNLEVIGDQRASLLKEGEIYQLKFIESTLVDVLIPKTMSFVIKYTEPGFKGDTSGTTQKSAILENDIEIQVPLFINIGDTVNINTDTIMYKDRVSKA